MHERIFFVVLLCGIALAQVDQWPIASFTCNLCASGNPLASSFLPAGYTCLDLDIALRNHNRSGCGSLLLASSGNTTTNDTAQVSALKADLENVRRTNILLMSILIPFTVICGLFGLVTCIWVRQKIRDGEFTVGQSPFSAKEEGGGEEGHSSGGSNPMHQLHGRTHEPFERSLYNSETGSLNANARANRRPSDLYL